MEQLPLMFCYRDLLAGNGWFAGVEIEGQALLVDEGEEGWWMYGVQPGGLAAQGADQQAATQAFRQEYSEILRDFAHESRSFRSFRREVQAFFSQTSDSVRWQVAREAIRAAGHESDWLPSDSTDDRTPAVQVVRVRRGAANDNMAEVERLAA